MENLQKLRLSKQAVGLLIKAEHLSVYQWIYRQIAQARVGAERREEEGKAGVQITSGRANSDRRVVKKGPDAGQGSLPHWYCREKVIANLKAFMSVFVSLRANNQKSSQLGCREAWPWSPLRDSLGHKWWNCGFPKSPGLFAPHNLWPVLDGVFIKYNFCFHHISTRSSPIYHGACLLRSVAIPL